MKKIELVEIRQVNDALAEMVALFRVELRSYKGIASKPNVEDGREEMKEYLLAGFPVFAATVHGEYVWNCGMKMTPSIIKFMFPNRNRLRQFFILIRFTKAESMYFR